MLCSLASTVACIVHADSWGEPPEVCDRYSIYYIEGLNCDQKHLEGTNGSAAVSIIQGMYSFVCKGIEGQDNTGLPCLSDIHSMLFLCFSFSVSYKCHFSLLLEHLLLLVASQRYSPSFKVM